jgi:hypothetical protein
LAADNIPEADLVEDFLARKHGGEDIYMFGRDAAGLQHDPHLRHVHLVPLASPVALKRWDRDWENYLRDRTSDRCLLYVDGTPAYGYLLLAVFNHPGGHGVWQNKALVAALAKVADNFFNFGKLPD